MGIFLGLGNYKTNHAGVYEILVGYRAFRSENATDYQVAVSCVEKNEISYVD